MHHKTPADWHPADVVAAAKKRGTPLSVLLSRHGYSRSAASAALLRPWPQAEAIIAKFIGIPPQKIWPSRYDECGEPKRRRPAPKSSDGRLRRNRARRRAA